MVKHLFISYSTADTAIAEQIRDEIEAQGIPCWMAPRDIAPGLDYAEQIIIAIEACSVLLLVLSESSNHSQYVHKEVERAIAKRKLVIPFRIHKVALARTLEFLISNAQWIDACEPPLSANLAVLHTALRNHLEGRATVGLPPNPALASAPPAPAHPALPAFLTEDAQPPAPASHFVAREAELRQLDGFLAQALNGQGQVVFIAGEAGAGKSALVQAFARQAQAHHAELIVVGGSCDAYAGIGDPYLPFCTVFSLLVGEVESGWRAGVIPTDQAQRLWRFAAQTLAALASRGPDLVDTLVAGATLLRQAHALAPNGADWQVRLEQLVHQRAAGVGVAMANQSNLFYQCSQVLSALAQVQPLLLLLDDLHWADGASLQLLFHLARQLKTSRVLIVGAYRPEDVALGRDGERHPLEPILNELKRAAGNIVVDLTAARTARGQAFVDALLDTEPHRLSAAFRQALYARTEGHPLFTIEVLRTLQERGELVKDTDDRWVESPTLDWATLPARVEGVIAERVARLGDELQQTLTIASVMGLEFTAQVVARVQALPERTLLTTLGRELDKRHRLVQEVGEQRIGRQVLTHYRFAHALFQHYLYQALSAGERRLLHNDIATTLEELYAGQTATIAGQLARHYDAAGDDEQAVVYLQQAAQQARIRYANDEAVEYLNRALSLVPAGDRRSRIDLLLAREAVYDLQGARYAQKRDLDELAELATTLGDAGLQSVVLGRQAHYARLTSDYPAAIAAARQALALAEMTSITSAAIEAEYEWAETLFHQGDYAAAAAQADKGLTRSHTQGDHRSTMRLLNMLGNIAGKQGDFATAQAYFLQILGHARDLGDRPSECKALANLGVVAGSQGDDVTARSYFEQGLALATMLGERRHESVLLLNLGLIANRQGDYTAARQALDQSLALTRLIGDRQSESISLLNLASVAGHLGDHTAALMYTQEALAIAKTIGDPDMEAWARLGEGHAHLELTQSDAAAVAYQAAMDIRLLLNQTHMTIEPRAGLARVALAEQKLTLALEYVESILNHLAQHTVDGADEPLLIYWTCYQVLQAHADPRAQMILQTAHELIQARAAKIEEEALRRSYLENVAVHRALMQEWQTHQAHC